MDINEYISSGILELYVAGALDPDQMREVEELAVRHPEIRAEISAIEDAVTSLARTDRNPRPELRSKIINEISALGSGVPAPAAPQKVVPAATAGATPVMRYLLAASIAIAVISSALAIYYWYQWNRTEMELANTKQRQEKTLNELTVYKARLTHASDAMEVLRSPQNKVVELKGVGNTPAATARVYWNPATKETNIDPGTLPPPPAGKQYQLWAIGEKGPVDAGVIDHDETILVKRMKDIATAAAFAVTLEPEGGRPTPTLDQMYVTGEL